ncbi:MAG TPA: hypothetical protein VGL39_14255 [Jatrophihabitantaceae bacterium]
MLIGVLGLFAAIIVVLLPIQYSVLGTTIDCGTGLTAWDAQPSTDDGSSQGIADACQVRGRERLLLVVIVGAVGAAFGIGVTLYERRNE